MEGSILVRWRYYSGIHLEGLGLTTKHLGDGNKEYHSLE
jgi:hypothetical protein